MLFPHSLTTRIYGGSSITGCYLIQLCRLSNLRVAVIASPQNAPYLRSLGAELILDRYSTSGELRIQLHAATSGRLAYAVDCVGSKTAAFCEAALQDADGEWEGEAQLVCLAGNPKPQAAKVGQRSVRALKTHKISFSTTVRTSPMLFSLPRISAYDSKDSNIFHPLLSLTSVLRRPDLFNHSPLLPLHSLFQRLSPRRARRDRTRRSSRRPKRSRIPPRRLGTGRSEMRDQVGGYAECGIDQPWR